MVIVATKSGNELRELIFSGYDIEVGEEQNTFAITCLRGEWETIPKDARIYIPGTEYGGLFRRLETNTEQGTITPGGYTWRGMLQRKIIRPAAGQDYATDSGELNAIIKARVEAAFPDLFFGSTADTGVSVSSYQYARYCTLYDGLQALLKSEGYKLRITYSETANGVICEAVPIVNYSTTVEFSSNMQTDYVMQRQSDGVNHLICLGTGELRNRTVIDLYADADGNISQVQTFTGLDEIAEVYDNPGAEYSDLLEGGTERLAELVNSDNFEIQTDANDDLEIGDIVGGRDYLSGMVLTAPVSSKIVKWSDGLETINFTLGKAGEVNL